MVKEIFFDEVFDAQTQFRIVLDSMARPGKINYLSHKEFVPPYGINKASALIGFSLLNADTSFCIVGTNNTEISEYIALNTNAQKVSIDKADFVFAASGEEDADFIFETKIGNLSYPEESATIIVGVEKISKTLLENSIQLKLKGPGIETESEIFIQGISTDFLNKVKEQNIEFPLGIDIMLTDKENRLVCIPRSTFIVVS